MSNIIQVLNESFRMLFERPKIFVPRFLSTSISSLAVIAWFTGKLSSTAFLLFFPLVAVLGAFTPVMVSSMVEKEGKNNLLRKSFIESLNLWKQILGLTGLTAFLAFLNSLPLSLGLMATYVTGNSIYLYVGGFVSLLILLGVSFALYFVPISLIKDGGLLEGLQSSMNASKKNRREVAGLTLFSLTVLVASSTVTGRLREIGLAVFYLGRISSSVVGTYLLVISPKFYLSKED